MRDDMEFNIQFCEKIENYPCLYDTTRSDYCNRSAQDQAWQKIAKKFDVQGAKQRKPYYLASHLQFLNSFLRSRQSKGNIVADAEEKAAQEEARDSDDESQNGDITDMFDETTQDSFPDEITTIPTTPRTPPPPESNGENSFRKKRKSLMATLADVNSSACKYFEAKQQFIEQRQNNKTRQLDPDMAFLQSFLPNMQAMNDRQKMRFKRGMLELAEGILYPPLVREASGSSITTQSIGSSMNALSTNSSMDTLARSSSTEGAPSMPTHDAATGGDQYFSMQQPTEHGDNYNVGKIQKYAFLIRPK
ncbi:unnamed protein product [Callosobruchus maculatus]|uniref:Uncharacterized protein n=1 Tax=Callosobruchus maculatus TaxID=64391 RepID=A0A653BU88_CALMS|nr:unnamed protein product [Callosobruchus maculatus]